MAGVTLPSVQQDEDEDEAEDKAINLLLEAALGDLVYDGHNVNNIAVPCASNDVIIGGEVFNNEHTSQETAEVIQKLMMDKKMTKRTIKENHPDLSEDLKLFYKHCDDRLHAYVLRKCHVKEKACKYCRENPPRSSQQFWNSMPKSSSGGLFYDVDDDPAKEGHYTTLLQDIEMVKNIKIKPDGKFLEVERCEEKMCLCSFKSGEDGKRHMRMAHNSKVNPMRNVCKFIINGTPCGESFESYWKLQRHKTATGHKQTRGARGSIQRGGRVKRGRKN